MRLNLGAGGVATFNPAIFTIAGYNAFEKTMRILQVHIDEVIQDPSAFPEFQGQDIVDTKLLLDSQGIFIKKPGEAEYNWGTDYAFFVHEGYTLRSGDWQPGRPWVVEAMRQANIGFVYANFLILELQRLGVVVTIQQGAQIVSFY